MLGKNRGMQPSATAVRAADPRVAMASTMSSRRHRKQPDRYGKLTLSNAIPSDCELENEDTDTADSQSDTSEDSNVLDQGPWADSSDDEQPRERPGPRSKRRSTAAAAAPQPASKKGKVAQPEAPLTASSKPGRGKGGGCARVIPLPDGGKAVETEIATSAYYAICLPSAFGSECFPNPPYDVALNAMVDGQLADLGTSSGQVRLYKSRKGCTQHRLCYKTGLWNSYPGHVITKLSTNSSSSELTCHLMSPAGQQAGAVAEAAAIAAAAAAGQTYWYEHQGTGRTLNSLGSICFPSPLLQKVFGQALPTRTPGSTSAAVKVDVSLYKENELASRANQAMIYRETRRCWMIHVPPEVRRQLTGFKLVRFRAAKPNLLEVYFGGEDAQELAAAAVAPVPPSTSPNQPAAAPSINQQAGTPPGGYAAGRMPSATAALAKQRTPPTPTPRAPTASAIAAARDGSSGGLPRLCTGGLAAGRFDSAAATSAYNTAPAAAATAGAHGNSSGRHSIQLAAPGAMPKAVAAAGVVSSGARAIGAEGAAAAISRPGTPAFTTPAQQTCKQVASHVSFDLPAANRGKAVSSNKEAGTGFGSHNRPELHIASSAIAFAANIAASKIPVAAGLQMAPKSAPKGRVELSATAARRANGDAVQGSASRSSTTHQAKLVLQGKQQLGIQQQSGTPAATGVIDPTISSDEETDRLPECHALNSAVPGSVNKRRNKKKCVYSSPNHGIAHSCSVHRSPWKQSAAVAAGSTPVARTVPAVPRPGLCATAAVKTVPAASTAAPGTDLVAAASAPAAPAALGLKLEAHTAVHNPTGLLATQTAAAANDQTRAAVVPAGFSLEPFRSVPLAFQQLVLLLEALAAPDELMQQLETAAQAMIDAEGAADWSRKLEVLEMQYSIVQAYVRRGRADLALDSVGVLLNRAVK